MGVTQSPLHGFDWIDYVKLHHLDRMHVDAKGIILDFLTAFREQTEAPFLDQLAHHLDNQWQPGSRPRNLPRHGLAALDINITAQETLVLAKCAVVFIAAIDSSAAEAMAGVNLDSNVV